MNTIRFLKLGVALVTLALFVAGCPNQTASTSSGGSLSIRVTNNIPLTTIAPPIDMAAASFTVSGTGPGGGSFSQKVGGGTLTVNDLAFGSWSVTVDALNAGGTVIGSGQGTATVHTGQTTAVAISVVPLAGNGSLSITATWTGSQVENPSIQSTLTPPSGSPVTPLSFSVTGNQATYSSTTIPAGYQTLTLQLFDNAVEVAGAAATVRIVAGQPTSGTIAFENVNQPGGSVQVTVTPALGNPIPVTIGGVTSTVTTGTNVTATASATDGTSNVVYAWYINGVSQATGPSYTFGSSLAPGSYRLDVTAFTQDGSRGGSASVAFSVSRTYTTSFSTVENPLSEGGNWINGGTVGLDWNDCLVATPGLVQGQGPSSVAFSDPTAIVGGTWGPNQTAQATVYSVNRTASLYQEVELRLRSTITAHSNTGYEVIFSCRPDSSAYTQIVRWNGPLGDFTYLQSLAGSAYGANNGDIVKATIVGNVISVYRNSTLVCTAVDSTFASGNPGIGFDYGCGTTYGDFGFTNFTVSD